MNLKEEEEGGGENDRVVVALIIENGWQLYMCRFSGLPVKITSKFVCAFFSQCMMKHTCVLHIYMIQAHILIMEPCTTYRTYIQTLAFVVAEPNTCTHTHHTCYTDTKHTRSVSFTPTFTFIAGEMSILVYFADIVRAVVF